MVNSLQPIIESMFTGVSSHNVDAATAPMSDDIVLFDPHYPHPNMVGIEAVREGISWAYTQMASMVFDIDRWFFSEDGLSAVVEVSTHHVLKMGGKRLDFPQVFVIETDGSQITKMRAYEPYGPHGFVGFGLKMGHTAYRLTHPKRAG